MLKNRKHLSKKKIRADQHVLAMGLADSISQAKALIMAGKVISGDQRVEKPGDMIFAEAEVRLKTDDSHYVSRGGEKLAGAIKYFALLDFIQGRTVLDVGASTGGFTHCCLEHGAKKVYSVDVGTNQLAWEMRKDPRVVAIERTDIRDLSDDHPLYDSSKVSFVVADISFQSLGNLIAEINRVAGKGPVWFLLLIKPQFELPRHKIPEGGVVEDDDLRREAVEKVAAALESTGIEELQFSDSSLAGRQGNREIFVFGHRKY